jgi:hypothetical protein
VFGNTLRVAVGGTVAVCVGVGESAGAEVNVTVGVDVEDGSGDRPSSSEHAARKRAQAIRIGTSLTFTKFLPPGWAALPSRD